MSQFSQGKYSFGICDRCGDKTPYKDLREEWTGFMVCKPCWDPKTKLEFPTNFPTDPESLRNPRPDADIESGYGIVQTDMSIGAAFSGGILKIELGEITVTVT
jgi:hypothetical protein